MKIIEIIISSIINGFTQSIKQSTINPIADLKNTIRENAYRFMYLISITVVVSLFFVIGLTITTLNISIQYDTGTNLRLTAVLTMGIVFTALSLISFFAIIHQTKNKDGKMMAEEEAKINPLQVITAQLIEEFIKQKYVSKNDSSLYKHEDSFTTEIFERH